MSSVSHRYLSGGSALGISLVSVSQRWKRYRYLVGISSVSVTHRWFGSLSVAHRWQRYRCRIGISSHRDASSVVLIIGGNGIGVTLVSHRRFIGISSVSQRWQRSRYLIGIGLSAVAALSVSHRYRICFSARGPQPQVLSPRSTAPGPQPRSTAPGPQRQVHSSMSTAPSP